MKPILFNTEMVRAILDGRKTVTRRLVKPRYREGEAGFYVVTEKYTGDFRYIETYDEDESGTDRRINPPCFPGDILYVREKFACDGFNGYEFTYVYWTDVDDCGRVVWGDDEKGEWAPSSDYRWRPSIHMPKEAARIFLRVTDVRVERLQQIMDDPPGLNNQIVREGCKYGCDFIALWDGTIKPADREVYGWTANPWVWVIEFERCEKPEEGE